MTSSLCCSQRLAARGFLRQRVARERLGSAVRPSRANVGSGHDASRRASARPARAWRTTRRASDDAHAAWHLPEASAARGMRVETLFVLETNVDDLSPQIVAYALEQMLAAGALDAWSVAAMMKKGRMGSLLCALCDRAHVDTLCEILFQVRSEIAGIRVPQSLPARRARLTAALPSRFPPRLGNLEPGRPRAGLRSRFPRPVVRAGRPRRGKGGRDV